MTHTDTDHPEAVEANIYTAYAEALAFLGNSLLSPMSQTLDVGLRAEFWRAFPDFCDKEVRRALDNLAHYAQAFNPDDLSTNAQTFGMQGLSHAQGASGVEGLPRAQASMRDAQFFLEDTVVGIDPVTAVSVEFTHLFVGPPSPAAAPWETFYRDKEVTSGFGHPTLEMRKALREVGLQVSNKNNQYDDHIGIELLYISTLCSSAASSLEESSNPTTGKESDVDKGCVGGITTSGIKFIQIHPLSWIEKFHEAIRKEAKGGYYDNLVSLTQALLYSLVTYARQ